MKAITIWQPWATAIALEVKGNETRSWATKHRGLIAIHAAKKSFHECWCRYTDGEAAAVICRRMALPEIFDYTQHFPLGCVIATAKLVDCIPITPEYAATLSHDELALGDYTPGRYAWKLENVQRITPIPTAGKQGLWNWDSDACPAMNSPVCQSYCGGCDVGEE